MLTGCGYRGYRLERIERSEFWMVSGEGSYTWNDALGYVDSITKEPEVPSLICKVCGHRELLKWAHKKQLIERQLCFSCDFWQDVMDDPSVVFAPGSFWGDPEIHAYSIGEEDVSIMSRGFGGRKFRLLFTTGAEIVTTNLWHRGAVPERFRERVGSACPRCAVFVND